MSEGAVAALVYGAALLFALVMVFVADYLDRKSWFDR